MAALVPPLTEVSRSTEKVISARVRSMISTSLTVPTRTPATRMSSPLLTPVASVNSALYSREDPKSRLPMVTTSTAVASEVTTTKTSSLTRSIEVFWIEDPAHRSDTSAPRAIGPTSSTPRSGTSSVLTPRPGASSDLSSADSSRPPAKPAAVPDQPGPTRLVPLPVGSSTPSTKSGW